MVPFMSKDFLLSNETARVLYHEAAEQMPIIDYHCHLSPREIAENRHFGSITQLMLGGDHYKWRQMLTYGFPEELIYGDGDDFEKFRAYATMLRRAIGNPLYHWTHLELKRVFGIDTPLNEDTAHEIYDRANEMLRTDDFRPQALIDRFRVETLCTTDDPVDDLSYHRAIAKQNTLRCRVLPAFRPDQAVHIHRNTFPEYIARLSAAANMKIRSAEDVLAALEKRIDFFHENGARLSDHDLGIVPDAQPNLDLANEAFRVAMKGEALTSAQIDTYRVTMLAALGAMYSKRGWVQQYHCNVVRNNNTRMFRKYGADRGFDSVADTNLALPLIRLLDAQDRDDALPKTILYALNPAANCAIATMLGDFQHAGVRAKMQMGSAWWFLDQRDGMEAMMKILANEGLLSCFVGMLTDSRSFISYPRHEYFRRILCNLIGGWVENGEYPADMEFLKSMIRDISFNNAKGYFNF